MQPDKIILDFCQRWKLKPHPEGGFYAEVARHAPKAGRGAYTSILFLLAAGQVSHLHRLDADEIWNYHAGRPLRIWELDDQGVRSTELGLGSGQVLQHVVHAGTWFGAELSTDQGFGLVGCAVAPAFAWEGFELAQRTTMVQQYPQAEALIERLTQS